MQRYYTFYSFLFTKNQLILSLDFNLLQVIHYLMKFKTENRSIGSLLRFKTEMDFFSGDVSQKES